MEILMINLLVENTLSNNQFDEVNQELIGQSNDVLSLVNNVRIKLDALTPVDANELYWLI